MNTHEPEPGAAFFAAYDKLEAAIKADKERQRVAARLAAETIAAQQAELRRLESALHQAEHEHMKAKAQAEAHETAANRLRQLVLDIRSYWSGGDCPDDLWNDIVDATEPTTSPEGWKHMDRIQRPETYR